MRRLPPPEKISAGASTTTVQKWDSFVIIH